MKDFKWQEDNWAYVELEEGVAVDVNFWTDDMSGKRYLTFYPTFIGRDCTVQTKPKPIANFRVVYIYYRICWDINFRSGGPYWGNKLK